MATSRDEVIWAYRIFFNRSPENDAVIQNHMQLRDLDALRSVFIRSIEFGNVIREAGITPVGRFQSFSHIPVEVECSEQQLAQMMAHISAEWHRYGQNAPHWSVLTGDDFKPDRIGDSVEAFYATGRAHTQVMLNVLSRSGVNRERFARVMDFGCGVGRLTAAMIPFADEILGVDISAPHVALAIDRIGVSDNVRFETIATPSDIDAFGFFDLIISFIVLQHNPPPVMAELLRRLLARLDRNGCIIIQIPTFIRGYTFDSNSYLASPTEGISANLLPQHVIFSIFAECGCRILEVREDEFLVGPSISHTFAAQKI